MKKIISVFLITVMIFQSAVISFAQSVDFFTENGFSFEIWEGNGEREFYLNEYENKDATEIYIPKTLGGLNFEREKLDAALFENCESVEAFKIDSDNGNFSVVDGVLFSRDKTELIAYPNNKSGEKYAIPEGTVEIAPRAFYYAKNVSELEIPSSLRNVSADAFGKSFEKNITEDNGLRYLGELLVDSEDYGYPYYITVKEGTRVICSHAIKSSYVDKLSLPSSLVSISDEGIKAKSLKSFILELPENLEYIGNEAFLNISQDAVTFPESIKHIGNRVLDSVKTVRIMNHECEIGDSIANSVSYVCGFPGSTAESFVEAFNNNASDETAIRFIEIGESHEHVFIGTVTKAPTCSKTGTEVFDCPCGEAEPYETEIEATGKHNFRLVISGGKIRFICSSCGYMAEFGSGDSDTDDKPVIDEPVVEACKCYCHHIDEDNSFKCFMQSLFFRIKLVIWRFAGKNSHCKCGVRHY